MGKLLLCTHLKKYKAQPKLACLYLCYEVMIGAFWSFTTFRIRDQHSPEDLLCASLAEQVKQPNRATVTVQETDSKSEGEVCGYI